MKRDVACCQAEALVTDAADRMKDRNVGFVPVCSDGRVVGAITDRDLTLRVLAPGHDPQRSLLAQYMTRPVISCSSDDELTAAEELMRGHQKSRVVCADDGTLRGVISLSDVAKHETYTHAGIIAARVSAREAAPPDAAPPVRVGSMPCERVMKRPAQCCHRHETIASVAAKMRDNNIGFVPVCDDEGGVIGTITDRDIAVRVVACRMPAWSTLAEEVLTSELVCCSPSDALKAAEDLMVDYKKSRILCVDAKRRALGVISLSDVARIERPARVSRVLTAITTRR